MMNFVLPMLQWAIGIWNSAMSDIKVNLTTTPAAFHGGGPWEVAANINTAIQGIAYGMMLLFFLMSFLKYTNDFRELSFQQIFGWIVRFLLVKFMIDYCIAILTFFINIALGVNDIVFTVAGFNGLDTASVPADVIQAFTAASEGNILQVIIADFQQIGLGFFAAIGALIIFVAGAVMVIVVFLRFFKLFIYTALAPIPLAFFGSQETSQTGKQFLKSYFAVCLEVCVIAVACVIFSAMVSSGYGGMFPSWTANVPVDDVNSNLWNIGISYIFEMALTCVMMAVVVFSANKFVREMLGV